MPLMAACTSRGHVGLWWRNPASVQPVFAAPNVLDGPAGHRFALEGTRLRAQIHFGGPQPLERIILWAVRRGGLPELPPQRPESQHRALCLKALKGALWNGRGWGHCAEPNWPRQPYADMASALFWLEHRVPELEKLVPGGAHIADPTAFFLTGRAPQWLASLQARAERARKQQRPDGSFRYSGPMARTHFENTASGYCARSAVALLEAAYFAGDAAALRAGLRALEFMKRFRTPRGAQTWEVPLHTPDILASALLVRAYVLGFELTGNTEYKEQAVRWAITGVPFVYLWGHRPIMRYATIAVYGATHWKRPVWIGRPVQWCGLVYAESIRRLAAHDRTLDWTRLAEGILRCAEAMQYTDGPYAGCLPDSVLVKTQQRFGPSINPVAIVALRRRLHGRPDGVYVVRYKDQPIIGPFPMELRQDRLVVSSLRGVRYQLLAPGGNVVTLRGHGRETVNVSRLLP